MNKPDANSTFQFIATRFSAMRALVFGGLLVAAALVIGLLGPAAGAYQLNGFELSGATVPEAEIKHGGPPRDGIPALDNPVFISAKQAASDAKNLKPESRVMGIVRNGVAKAYPILIMNWHEIVNDRFADEPVLVTFCPLCGTGIAYESNVAGKPGTFGVSGLLYNSDMLLYDKQTESLWSQMLGSAIAGQQKNARLKPIATSHTSWRDWSARHPNTLVLTEDTGHNRDYQRDPYLGYEDSKVVMFQVRNASDRYHPKELVLGLTIGGKTKAWPFSELRNGGHDGKPLLDSLAGAPVSIRFDDANNTARALNESGEQIPGIVSFWFAWYAFHPESQVFTAVKRVSVSEKK